MNLGDRKVRTRLCEKLAAAIETHGTTFKEVRTNERTAQWVYEILTKEAKKLSRAEFDQLVAGISASLDHANALISFWENDSYAGKCGRRAGPLPTLDQQERVPDHDGIAHGQFGWWPKN